MVKESDVPLNDRPVQGTRLEIGAIVVVSRERGVGEKSAQSNSSRDDRSC